MASFGQGLISGFTSVYGTLARGALQAEQAAYYRNQREGTEEYQRRGRELQRELGIDPNATVPAPQTAPAPAPAQGQAPAATPQPGAVQGALGGAPAATPAQQPLAPSPPPQAPVQTGVAATGAPERRPPVSPEDFERAANSGDPILMANAAGVVVGSQGGVPGQTGDTQGPRQLANEVSAANGGVRGPLTRQHWNTYYQRRINDAMELLPPDQAVRVVGMLDQQRERGFGQMISLAVAAAESGDAQGAARALFGASNFNPDGFKDDFRVAPGGRGIEIIRTPESGQGEPQRMTVPLNQVSRYATTMLDPKWSMTHQLNVRELEERSRSARVREGQQAQELRLRGEDLKLRNDDREERRRIDLNSGQAIESAARVARAQVEYDSAVRSGDQTRVDAALEKLNTEEAKDADLVGMGVNTRGATGRQQAASAVQNAATRRETAEARMARWNDMTQLAQSSLALRAEDRAAARTQAAERLTQYDRGLDLRALSIELRTDVARARIELSQARDDNTKRIAEERLRIAEERLNLAVRTQSRREGDEGRITPQTRAEVAKALESITAMGNFQVASNSNLGGSASGSFAPMQMRNPNFPTEDVVRFTNDLFKNPRGYNFGPDFSYAQNAAGTRMTLPDNLRDSLRSYAQLRGAGGATAAEPTAPQDSGGSMYRGAVERTVSSGPSQVLADLSDRELKAMVAPYARAGAATVPANVREAREILRVRELEKTRPNPPSARFRGNVSGE
jgi:hypothetical protein